MRHNITRTYHLTPRRAAYLRLGKKDMPNLEKILCDLESYRDDHYLYEHANTVLRKRFLENPPRGVTKAEIRKMSPEDLIALDMYHEKSV